MKVSDLLQQMESRLNEASNEDEKYTHLSKGVYVKKGEEKKEDAQKFKKDGDSYTPIASDEKGGKEKSALDKTKEAEAKKADKKTGKKQPSKDLVKDGSKQKPASAETSTEEGTDTAAVMKNIGSMLPKDIKFPAWVGEVDFNNYDADEKAMEFLKGQKTEFNDEGQVTRVDGAFLNDLGIAFDTTQDGEYAADLGQHWSNSITGILAMSNKEGNDWFPEDVKKDMNDKVNNWLKADAHSENIASIYNALNAKKQGGADIPDEALKATEELYLQAEKAAFDAKYEYLKTAMDVQSKMKEVGDENTYDFEYQGTSDGDFRTQVRNKIKELQDLLGDEEDLDQAVSDQEQVDTKIQDAFKDKPGVKKFSKTTNTVFWEENGKVMSAPADNPDDVKEVDDKDLIAKMGFGK